MGTPSCRRRGSCPTAASASARLPCTTTGQRLLDLDLIEEAAANYDQDRRRRNYRLTKHGRALLQAELERVEVLVRKAKAMNWNPAQVKS